MNALTSSVWTDSTRQDVEILHWALPSVCLPCVYLIAPHVTRSPRPSPTVFHIGSNQILVLATRLHQVFVQELGQKYVIIVGDAKTSKTYNTLQEICHEYKSTLKWLTPFPGDWHVLYNFQKALMKPYKDAGQASLGKVSGHQMEMLTSLLMIQASNFWQTHEFLPQAYEVFYR